MSITFCFKSTELTIDDFLGSRKIKEKFILNLDQKSSHPVDDLIVQMTKNFDDCDEIYDGDYSGPESCTMRVVVTYAHHNNKQEITTTGAISLKNHKCIMQWDQKDIDYNSIEVNIKKFECIE